MAKITSKKKTFNPIMIFIFLISLMVLPTQSAQGFTSGNFTISQITPDAALDSNKSCTSGPDAMYLQVDITNTSGVALSDVTVTINNFSTSIPVPGGDWQRTWALDSEESPTRFVTSWPNGVVRNFWWYVVYPCYGKSNPPVNQLRYNITLSAPGHSPDVTYTGNYMTTSSEISAAAGATVTTFTIDPGIIYGQIVKAAVVYTLGNISASEPGLLIEPAGNSSFDASCFRLIAVDIVSSSGFSGTFVDNQLYQPTISSGSTGNIINVDYYFQAVCTSGPTTELIPSGSMVSGIQMKYLDAIEGSSAYCRVNPARCTTNAVTEPYEITKTVSPDHFMIGDAGIVMYKVIIHNTSTTAGGYLNLIKDVLPAGAQYIGLVTGNACDTTITNQVTSAKSYSEPLPNATGTIEWIGLPVTMVPPLSGEYYIGPDTDGTGPLGNLALCYNASIPTTAAGTFSNGVNAYVSRELPASIGYAEDTVYVTAAVPALAIIKTTSPTSYSVLNETITYTYTATNIGNALLNNVTISDPMVGLSSLSCSPSQGSSLTVNASMVCTATYQITQANLDAGSVHNTGTADSNQTDPPVTDNATITANQNPSIDIQKYATAGGDTQQIRENGTANFTIVVTNTGNVTLTNVIVTDTLAPGCANTFATLAPSTSESYTCSVANVTADFVNEAVVTGTPPVGANVTDNDPSSVDVIHPSIDIRKNVEGADSQQARVNDTVTFTIVVTNTGDVDLTAVAVTDPLATNCASTIGALAAGANSTYTCTLVVTADMTNVATVTGTPPVGANVTDNDPSSVDVIHPSIDIRKNVEGADSQQARVNDTVTFTIVVTNTGDVDLTAVAVTDPLATNCASTIGALAAGASSTYTCTLVVTAEVENIATVTGTPPVGADVTDSDISTVDVIFPSITITKNGDGDETQTIPENGTANFTIVVTNTGDVALDNVTVTDALAADCVRTGAGNLGTLAVGASTSYTCSVLNVAADFVNQADVTGTPPVGANVTDSDISTVDVIIPSITITKNGDGDETQQIRENGTANFTIVVTNTGDVALSNVTVTDTLAPGCGNTFLTLAVGAIESYTCSVANVMTDFVNQADVTGTPPAGANVTDSDPSSVDVIFPSITITKNGDGDETQTIRENGTANFTIVVTNTGDVALSNVTVTDALAADCVRTGAGNLGTLTPSASTSYTCSVMNVLADFVNQADVTGTPPVGADVTDSDISTVDVIFPGITITKNGDGDETQTIPENGTANFTIVVTNTGDVALSNVTVTDALAADCVRTGAGNLGTLAVGASTSYTCSVLDVAADFVNQADVTGTPPVGANVTDSDISTVDVIIPSITITKNGDGDETQQIRENGTANFTIVVTNTGDVALSNVTVTDALAADCVKTGAGNLGTLAVGASTSYTCSVMNVLADFVNQADVTGTPPVGANVTDSDISTVDVIFPSITITKNGDGDETQQIRENGTANFTIVVTNTGDVALSNVTVTDALAADCVRTGAGNLGTLTPSASTSYTCSVMNVLADFVNQADVTGTPPVGANVTDSDISTVDVIFPSITITKNGDGDETQTIRENGTANFTIVVTNTGDVALSNVTVTDALAADCVRTGAGNLGTLTPSASTSYTCSVMNVLADFVNEAIVTGTPPVGANVTDSDPSSVDVIFPSITITKNGDGDETQQIRENGTANFTIVVTNTGDVALDNVTVTDALAADCERVDPGNLGTLAPSTSVSYDCSVLNVAADFVNQADVTGTPPVGANVTDSDISTVDVIFPSITITKNGDGDETQTIRENGTANFTIVVTNTGDVALDNVTVTDALAADCERVDPTDLGTLAAGASTSYMCSVTNVLADFVNQADVTGTPPVGADVTDSDISTVDVIFPSITITKNGDGDETQTIRENGTANFTIVVTNTGDVALDNVTVTDALAADCVRTGAGNLGTLAPSASTSYTCSVTNVLADFVNEAIVTGTPPVGADVTDSDISTVDVIFPSIYIRKNAHDPDSQLARVNDTVTFTIYVENTGDVDLANVAVTDPLASECDSTIGDLVVDATSTYTCTLVVTADVENIATVTGTPPVGANVTDSDPSSVDVIHPSIDIRKNMEGTDSQQAVVGSTVTFTINVRNTGDVALTNVAVSDPLAPNCVSTIGNLAVGTSITPYTCTLVVTDDMTNVATVTGMAPVGPDVTDTDPSSVDVITPAIYIQKNAHDLDSQLVLLGSTVTFTIYVQNTGNVTLTNVTVTDPLAPNCDRTGLNNLGTLLPGATSSYNCTAIATTGFTNVATVTGTPPVGSNVTDNDPSQVVIANPAMRVTKSVTSTGPYSLGSTISYTILVENIGDIALTGVTVTDPGTGVTLGACTPTIPATLAVAASLTCQATHVVTQADIDGGGFYNVAFADSNETEEVSDDEAVDIERTPAIDIRKNAESTDTQQILLGGNATFHIVVTNTGNLTLYNVAVTDVLAPDCERITPDLGTLLPGGSVEYDCTVTNVTLGFTNIAQVTALAPNEAVVTDEDPSTVTILVNPSNLAKQLISTNQSFTTGDKVAIGEIITYRVTAVIPSTSQYSSMKLTDSMDRGLAFVDCTSITGTGLVTSIGSLDDVCANTIGTTYLPGSLDPRDQGRQVVFDFGTLENPTQSDITLTITYTAVVLNSSGNVNGIDLGNSVNLTWGVGSSLGPVAAPDVEIVEPRLNVTKTATPTLITVGTEVTFTLTIAHDPAFSTTEAYNVILIDQLPVELGNVSGLDCTTGAQDPATCIYSSSTRTLRAEWSSFTRSAGNGVIIFRATVLSIPDSREITNSITGEWTSLPGDVSDPQSDFNDLSDERTFPPGMSVDNYIDTDEIVLRPASQPSTGFAPGRQTVIDLPRSSIYAELGDLTLEIPILGVNIPIVGVPLVDQEWDLTWLWNKAGWLNETAYPTWNGNSVMTGHVYLPNGLPGPFLNLDKLEWGDQIIVHANGLRYIYQIRAVNTVKADDMSAFKHEEKSWVTLITCKEYNETTDTYKKRIVVQAVLVEITKELGATQ